jgi:preprotein translocase subunit SecG
VEGNILETLKILLIIIYWIVSVALIILALMQSKDDEGASGAIIGGASSSFYEKNKGRTREGILKRWTIILGVTFGVLTVALGIIYML